MNQRQSEAEQQVKSSADIQATEFDALTWAPSARLRRWSSISWSR